MFLEVVPFARNVGNDFLAVCEADFRDFAEGGVRLLRRAGHDLHADAAALRTIDQGGRFRFDRYFAASFADQLVDRGHY